MLESHYLLSVMGRVCSAGFVCGLLTLIPMLWILIVEGKRSQ
jgi:hypothetical protein